eukprot:scaffold95477_cov34-Tisochrysis_lutea.AAC.3
MEYGCTIGNSLTQGKEVRFCDVRARELQARLPVSLPKIAWTVEASRLVVGCLWEENSPS